MALKFRRGTTAQQSGSLTFGEPYVNTTLGTLVIGGAEGDIVLSSTGTGSTGVFGAISGSGLDITGNANIAGNLTLGGAITIGDASADTVNVVASLSSSLIPATTNAFDLGSASKIWRDLYISTGSIKFVEGTSVVKTLNATTLTALEAATGSANSAIVELNAYTASNDTTNTTQNSRLDQLSTASGSSITRLTALEVETSNLETFSGSAITRLTALEVETSNLESFTSSINTTIKSKLDSDGVISGSSQITLSSTTGFSEYSTSVDSRITTEKGRVDAILLSADADKDSFAEIVTLINSVDTTNDTAFASFYTASVGRLNNLESTSASVNISVSNLNTYTGSNDTTNTTQNSRLDQLSTASGSAITRLTALEVETANLEAFTSSINTTIKNRLDANTVISGSSQVTGLSNAQLTNSTISGISLGSNLATLTIGTGLSGTSYNGSGAVTIANTGVTSNVAGTGVSVSGATGAVTISIGQSVATNATPTFGNLTINGTITATGDITAFFTSDKRHKNSIQTISNAVLKVKQLNGVTWEWNDDVSDVTKSTPKTGLIAQEVQQVLPQVVIERADGFLALDYSKMVGLLVEAIKEQQTQIDQLKAQIGSK